jgi:5-methylcytosine-specific restriction endonuclease McrA
MSESESTLSAGNDPVKKTKSRAEYNRRWVLRNHDKHRASGKKWADNNKKKVAQYGRIWREKNREKLKQKRRQYYLKNRARAIERARDWVSKNREKKLERTKQWHSKNKEKSAARYRERFDEIKQRKSAYYAANTERLRAINKEWRLRNSDKLKQKQKEWTAKNKQRLIEYRIANKERRKITARAYAMTERGKAASVHRSHLRRAREKKCETTATKEFVMNLLRNAKACAYCSAPFSRKLKAALDHIIPISKGGGHTPENLIAACRECNSSKHNKDPLEFVKSRGLLFIPTPPALTAPQ